MNHRSFQLYFFALILMASSLLTILVFRSYLVPLALGGVLAVVSRPLFKYLHKNLRSDTAAAFLTVVLISLTILAPLSYFLAALTQELGDFFTDVRHFFDVTSFSAFLQQYLPVSMQSMIPQVTSEAMNILRVVVGNLSSKLVGFFSNALGFFISLLIMLISAYYLLKDGAKVKKELLVLSPLSDENDEIILNRLVQAVSAVMNGMLIIGLIKGVLSGLAFWMFGVPAPMFWGAMTALAFFIPFVGSALVTGPAIIYLVFSGHAVAGVGLAVVSVAVIGAVDNVLQPKLVQSKTNLHPLLVLLSIVGGIEFYGFAGFILGPLTLAVTMALLDIYKKDIKAPAARTAA